VRYDCVRRQGGTCWVLSVQKVVKVSRHARTSRGVTDRSAHTCISHKVLLKSFLKSRLSHKSVNLFFIFVTVKDKLTDVVGELT